MGGIKRQASPTRPPRVGGWESTGRAGRTGRLGMIGLIGLIAQAVVNYELKL